MAYLMVNICLVCALANIQKVQPASRYPKLLVVSYDAFRYDYLDRRVTPFMNYLKNQGTHADHMINVFNTKTFTNHHSIATGFYAETHGVLGTSVYDANKTIEYSPELFQYDKHILPIWTINERAGNGRHSGVVMWPGSQFKYGNTSPLFVMTFNRLIPWKNRVDTMISWFTHPKTPINFGVLYIEEPDASGHKYGINAPAMNRMLKKLDDITKYLHDKLRYNNLGDVNVVHLSDHGMISVTQDRIVNVSSYVSGIPYRAISTDMMIMITSDPGNEDIIFEKLNAASIETSKFDVYKRKDIPERYHFRNNPRVGDVVVIARSGYAFEALSERISYYKEKFHIEVNDQSEFGVHGYDNEDMNMHPIFFAGGPAFVDKCKIDPFNNVDLFPLFCKILELNCLPVNGTLHAFTKCLTQGVTMPNSRCQNTNY